MTTLRATKKVAISVVAPHRFVVSELQIIHQRLWQMPVSGGRQSDLHQNVVQGHAALTVAVREHHAQDHPVDVLRVGVSLRKTSKERIREIKDNQGKRAGFCVIT